MSLLLKGAARMTTMEHRFPTFVFFIISSSLFPSPSLLQPAYDDYDANGTYDDYDAGTGDQVDYYDDYGDTSGYGNDFDPNVDLGAGGFDEYDENFGSFSFSSLLLSLFSCPSFSFSLRFPHLQDVGVPNADLLNETDAFLQQEYYAKPTTGTPFPLSALL